MRPIIPDTHPERHAHAWEIAPGEIRWAPAKSLLFTGTAVATLLFGWQTATVPGLLVFALGTAACLGLGHSVGLHRGLIHGTFQMGRTTKRVLLWMATLTGIGPVLRLMDVHDRRDLWQNKTEAPAYYTYRHGLWTDFLWYLHCDHHPPRAQPGVAVFTRARHEHDPVLRWLDRTWIWQQLGVALPLFWMMGWTGVVWGCCARIAMSMAGHWLVNFMAHRKGDLDHRIDGAGEEGRNNWVFGALSMGEGWHNNHHAFPTSARHGLRWWQIDVSYMTIWIMSKVGLARDIRIPSKDRINAKRFA